MDPNIHMRHSVYYDLGAQCRLQFLYQNGITAQFMHEHHIGVILMREECLFKREIHLGDRLVVNLRLLSATRDYSRWSMQNQLIKNGDVLAAVITVDGAWMDIRKRKLAAPPPEVCKAFEAWEKDESFTWMEPKSKQ
jgi:acyl-CoA thioester hydrolase